LAVSNEIKGLAAAAVVFALPKPAESNRPPPTALAGRDRRRDTIFQAITTFVFPEDNVAPRRPAPAIATSPTRLGKRTRAVATSGSPRWARDAGRPDSMRGRSAHSEGSKSDPPAPLVGYGGSGYSVC